MTADRETVMSADSGSPFPQLQCAKPILDLIRARHGRVAPLTSASTRHRAQGIESEFDAIEDIGRSRASEHEQAEPIGGQGSVVRALSNSPLMNDGTTRALPGRKWDRDCSDPT